MAPKKGNRKQEDWEAELGESIPAAGGDSPTEDAPPAEGGADGEAAGSGGLLAALRKNKNKKAKKGKPANDFVEGEDASEGANGDADFSSKQPEEGTFDEDDVFAGKKNKPIKAVETPAAEPEDDDSGPRVKTKKEKEREKKEREKQRKREQVGFFLAFYLPAVLVFCS